MATVKIVTDSTHNLPADTVARHGFGIVSLYVNEGGATTRESDLDLGAFYDRLRTSEELPTTSQPSLGDFLAVYEPLLAAGHDIVSVHLAGGISGTIETAHQAAAEARSTHPERRVEVVDSNSTGGGLALVLLSALAAGRQRLLQQDARALDVDAEVRVRAGPE